ncbi:MAG: TIGR04168 family protein [Pleurocapsa sp.]
MIGFSQQITIAIVGDVHDLWDEQDEKALKHLGVDLVLFVGDFGNESVDVVRQIAEISLPKAAIMGNHDAWYSASAWGRNQAPYDRNLEDRVQQQLDLLGDSEVGFSKKDFPQFNLSVVGSRPFSWGGSNWKNKQFYRDRYGVNNFAESTLKILEAARNTAYDTLIFIGHNGPWGLGDRCEDICGRDWRTAGGDYGDPDFTEALDKVHSLGKSIPLVTFGHMHHRLKHSEQRRQILVNQPEIETIYYNAACVPRLVGKASDLKRSFSLVTLNNGVVEQVSLVWLDRNFDIQSKEILYSYLK